MEFPVLSKPWRDLERYREARLREAQVEARLALEFLEDGLIRNAAGKAFQAWKAYLAARLAEKRDVLRGLYPGSRRVRVGEEEVEVEDVDVVIALVPTAQMLRLSGVVGGDAVELTALALDLHRYQYNGPDPEGFFSDVPDDRTAALLICRLAERLAADRDLLTRVCGVSRGEA
ncbi:PaREP1 domain containing protein [Thermoproteus uzoniensis 768-20]|uniref:PaREP1 domain containing protein n=1 Tax=Thermoproteus uzoniensis (strain 768-20) TaxID=999630 RepID=F2L1E8_THEU7|nr:PaREP1 family protein [Thermoproteus uzoniensis]AEA11618.1 PaREP1 domain containing protein [Thermoproteus uzoniensis 768-20]